MKRLIFSTLPAIIALATPASAMNAKELKRYERIAPGLPTGEVLNVMGEEPGNREFKGKRVAWQYCARQGVTANKFVVIYFNEAGEVEQVKTYTKPFMGGCKGQFNPVEWDEVKGGE